MCVCRKNIILIYVFTISCIYLQLIEKYLKKKKISLKKGTIHDADKIVLCNEGNSRVMLLIFNHPLGQQSSEERNAPVYNLAGSATLFSRVF